MSPTEKLIQIRLLASGPIRNPTPRATLMKIRRLIDEPEATTVFETEALRVKPSLALAEKYGCSPSLAASFQEALDRAAAELANPSPPKNTFERVEMDGGESERPIVSWKRGNHPEGPRGESAAKLTACLAGASPAGAGPHVAP